MRGLLEKDFRLLKGQKNFFLLILVITVLLSLNSENNFAVTYLTFIAGFLTISSFGYDDNGNCMPFLMTLPVSRMLYVKSKYLLGFLLTFIGWLAGMVISVITALLHKAPPTADAVLFQLAWVFLWMIMLSFVLPMLFKFGAEKGRMATLAMMLVFMAIVFAFTKLAEGMGMDMDACLNALAGQQIIVLVAGLAVVALILVLISYFISVKIVQKKEY
ncbi:MAG: ABC-2 transporter permease [Eubacterium sp.]|nr:ABC-2 transporter permease [Eubacterium sp.]